MADTLKQQVEEKLLKAEEGRKVKDIGRVSHSKKEMAAYRIITMGNIDEINKDEIAAFNLVKKDSIWPPIDIEQQKLDGVTSGACFIKVKIREGLPAKPKNNADKRKAYVHFLNIMQNDLLPLKTLKEVDKAIERYLQLSISDTIRYFINADFLTYSEEKKKEIQDKFTGENRWGHISSNYFIKKIVEEVFGKTFLNLLTKGSDASYSNWKQAELYDSSEGEEQKYTDQALKQRAALKEVTLKKIEEWENADTEGKYKIISSTYTKTPSLKQFKSDDQFNSEKYYKLVYGDLLKRRIAESEAPIEIPIRYKKRDQDWSWSVKEVKDGEAKERGRTINKKVPLDYIKRVGGYKTPEPTPKNVVDIYGFNAYNFGKYVPDSERAEHAKHFIGALTDLSDILNIDISQVHKMVGLGFGVGLKGYGGHLASYFPQTKDINLTRGSGDGSVAHEWGHFFDNMLSDFDVKKAEPLYASNGHAKDSELSILFKELTDLFSKGVPGNFVYKSKTFKAIEVSKNYADIKILGDIDASIEQLLKDKPAISYYSPDRFWTEYQEKYIGYVISKHGMNNYPVKLKVKNSLYYRDSMDVSAGNYKYWCSNVEMFARAFETYIFKKLASVDMSNNYLAHDSYLDEGMPYPRGVEYDAIEKIIDKIFIRFKKAYNINPFTPIFNERIGEEVTELVKKEGSIEKKIKIEIPENKTEPIITTIKEEPTEVVKVDLDKKSLPSEEIKIHKPEEPIQATTNSFTVEEYKSVLDKTYNGKISLDDFKYAFDQALNSESSLKAELSQMNKSELLKLLPRMVSYRYKNEKKDATIDAVINDIISFFALGSYSYMYGEDKYKGVKDKVEKLTDASLREFAESVAKSREEHNELVKQYKKAIDNPETLEEFKIFIKTKGVESLPTDKRVLYDQLISEKSKEKQLSDIESKAIIGKIDTTASMSLMETKHTKTGIPLFVVKMSERVSSEVYKELNAKAKQLGGWYSSYSKEGAIAGFQFKEKQQAEKFMALKEGSVSNIEKVEERIEKKLEHRAEKLRKNAETIIQRVDAELSKDRLSNTARRASMASHIEGRLNSEKSTALIMLKLADAIDNGETKLLDRISTRSQVDQLRSIISSARHPYFMAKYPTETERRSHDGEEPTEEYANYINKYYYFFPELYVDRWLDVINKYESRPGLKLLGERIKKKILHTSKNDHFTVSGQSEMQDIIDFAEKIPEDYDTQRIKTIAKDHKRLVSMGIDSNEMLRAVIREFITFSQGTKQEVDKVKKLERELAGKKVGFDFFPTPHDLSERMAILLDIQPGMEVLEPSAGNGNLADAVKKVSGVVCDVVEVSSDLREILEAKGYNVVANDFDSYTGKLYDRIIMNPPFSNRLDAIHVMHAYELLKPGGKIVAIMGEGVFFGSDKKAVEFRDWSESINAEVEKLPVNTFMDKRLTSTTGANARLITINKPEESNLEVVVSAKNNLDMTAIDYIDIDNKLKSDNSIYFYIQTQVFDEYQIWCNDKNFGMYSKLKNEKKFHRQSLESRSSFPLINNIKNILKEKFQGREDSIIRDGINTCGFRKASNDEFLDSYLSINSIYQEIETKKEQDMVTMIREPNTNKVWTNDLSELINNPFKIKFEQFTKGSGKWDEAVVKYNPKNFSFIIDAEKYGNQEISQKDLVEKLNDGSYQIIPFITDIIPGQSYSWMSGNMEHNIVINSVDNGNVTYRFNGKDKTESVEKFSEFLKKEGVTPNNKVYEPFRDLYINTVLNHVINREGHILYKGSSLSDARNWAHDQYNEAIVPDDLSKVSQKEFYPLTDKQLRVLTWKDDVSEVIAKKDEKNVYFYIGDEEFKVIPISEVENDLKQMEKSYLTISQSDWGQPEYLAFVKDTPMKDISFADFKRALTSEWDKENKNVIHYYFDGKEIASYNTNEEKNYAPLREAYNKMVDESKGGEYTDPIYHIGDDIIIRNVSAGHDKGVVKESHYIDAKSNEHLETGWYYKIKTTDGIKEVFEKNIEKYDTAFYNHMENLAIENGFEFSNVYYNGFVILKKYFVVFDQKYNIEIIAYSPSKSHENQIELSYFVNHDTGGTWPREKSENGLSIHDMISLSEKWIEETNVKENERKEKDFNEAWIILEKYIAQYEKDKKSVNVDAVQSAWGLLYEFLYYNPKLLVKYTALSTTLPKQLRLKLHDGYIDWTKFLNSIEKASGEWRNVWSYLVAASQGRDLKPIKKLVFNPVHTDSNLKKIVSPFASNDGLRVNIAGIQFEENAIVASDAWKLIHINRKTAETGLFCMTTACEKTAGENMTEFKQIDGVTFPAYSGIVPKNHPYEYNINAYSLLKFIDVLDTLNVNLSDNEKTKFIALRDKSNDITLYIYLENLMSCVESMLLLGHEEITIAVRDGSAALVITPKGNYSKVANPSMDTDFTLVMPIVGSNLWGNFYFDLTSEQACTEHTDGSVCSEPLNPFEVKALKVQKDLDEIKQIKSEIEDTKNRAIEEEQLKSKDEQDRIAAEILENQRIETEIEEARKLEMFTKDKLDKISGSQKRKFQKLTEKEREAEIKRVEEENQMKIVGEQEVFYQSEVKEHDIINDLENVIRGYNIKLKVTKDKKSKASIHSVIKGYEIKIKIERGKLEKKALGGTLCPHGTIIQSLIFSKEHFTKDQAIAWSKNHGKKYVDVDEKQNTYRLRQIEPNKVEGEKTITITEGVKAVIGVPVSINADGGSLKTYDIIQTNGNLIESGLSEQGVIDWANAVEFIDLMDISEDHIVGHIDNFNEAKASIEFDGQTKVVEKLKSARLSNGGIVLDENGVFVDENEENDLFVHYERLPKKMQKILEDFGEPGSYERCETLLEKIKPLGYTFDYGLDGIPYGLEKISEKKNKGGNISKSDLKRNDVDILEYEYRNGDKFYSINYDEVGEVCTIHYQNGLDTDSKMFTGKESFNKGLNFLNNIIKKYSLMFNDGGNLEGWTLKENYPDNPFNIPVYANGDYVKVFMKDVEPIWIDQNKKRAVLNADAIEAKKLFEKLDKRKRPKKLSANLQLMNDRDKAKTEYEKKEEERFKIPSHVAELLPKGIYSVVSDSGELLNNQEAQKILMDREYKTIYEQK